MQELLLLQAKSPQLELPWGQAACCLDSSSSHEVLLLTKYHLVNIVIPRGSASGHDMERILYSSMVSDFFFLHLKRWLHYWSQQCDTVLHMELRCSNEPQLLELFCYCRLVFEAWAARNAPMAKQNHYVRLLWVTLASFETPQSWCIEMKSHVGNVSQCCFLCFRKTITALAFSPDGKYLVTGEVSVRGEKTHLVHCILKQGRGA